MKLLHTSDWHVGKAIRGHSRADEHRAVLAEIVGIAGDENVDLIAIAGDFYETAAPSAESESIVLDTLMQLGDIAPVVAVAGNHDNARRMTAVAPLLERARVALLGEASAPGAGGRIELMTESGTPVAVVLLPFVSQRAVVRAAELMSNAAYENVQAYSQRMFDVLQALCSGFEDNEMVNVVVAHAYVTGATKGGGERLAHLTDEYGLSATDFPAAASYVALGHLHRAQQMLGASPIHYCGSPLQLDFGEEEQTKQVNLVEVEPGLPAKVQPRLLNAGRRLRTLTGTLADMADHVDDVGDDWIRVNLTESNRVGLADEARELLGSGVVDVRIEREIERTARRSRSGRNPAQLFGDYLAERDIADESLTKRFGELHDEVLQAGSSGDPSVREIPGGEA